MDLFAGLDGLSASSSKTLSLAEQQKLRESQNLRLGAELDALVGQKPAIQPTPVAKPVPVTRPPPAVKVTPLAETTFAKPAVKSVPQPPVQNDFDDDVFGLFASAPPQSGPQAPKSASTAQSVGTARSASAAQTTRAESYASESSRFGSSQTSRFDSHSGTSRPNTSRPQARTPPFQYARELAQLEEMGFEPKDGRRALLAMEGSVSGSVSWLMAEAQGLPLPAPRKPVGFSSGDFSNVTSSVFSKASSLWSKGRKELEKAYNQYNGHPASNGEPAWMRDKAKYDRQSFESAAEPEVPDLPQRAPQLPRRKPEPTPDLPQRKDLPQRTPDLPTRPSRAELFRQKQRERNSPLSSPAMSSSGTSPAPSPPPPSQAAGTRERASAATPAAPDPTDAVDLLNLSGPVSSAAALSSTSHDLYSASRELGTASFRNGDYEKAVEHYTAALQVVPESHLLRAVLLSNRAAASMKAGNLRGALDDTQMGIDLLPTRGKGVSVDDGTDLSDIWVKLVTRNAQAAEHMEKFDQALVSYQLLLDNGHASSTVLAAKRRCNAALNPENVAKATAEAPKKSQRRGWGMTGAQPTSQAGKEALAKVKEQHAKQENEERERELLADKIGARVDAWKSGNEKNLRVLLATLQNVLWTGCDWTPISAADLVVPRKARIAYMKAVSRTHPDKVPASAPVEVKMISQSVFVTLQTAWDEFRQENNL